MRKAFTIVELMMVVGIIGILLGIVTTAASGSIKQARKIKSEACCRILEEGFKTYYAQHGEWPGFNADAVNGNVYQLSTSEVREAVRKMIAEVKKNNPPMNISGLYVSRSDGTKGSRHLGMDFKDAIRGTKRSQTKMATSEMYFGYPHPNNGYFRNFVVKYYGETDSLTVSTQDLSNDP